MRRKKILHLINGLEIGGTEMQLLRILPELQKYHESQVCCLRGHGSIGKDLEKMGVKVHYIETRNVFDILAVNRLRKIIKHFSPEILTTYLIHSDLYGRFFGKLFGIKKIVCSKRGALLQWEWLVLFDRLTKFIVTRYLVQTKTAQIEWMNKLKIKESNFSIISNGIDVKKFQIKINQLQKKKEIGIKDDSFIISCVSKLRRGKGHDVLLEAFEKVYAQNNKVTLLIIGDGEREVELKNSTIDFTSKNKILFLGNRSDVAEILSISDLFILPTEKEGMSNAIIEAMSAGIPIITTNLPENRDLIDNQKTGILFPLNDIDRLKDAIESLIASPNLRKEIGQNAQKKAEVNYDVRVIANQLAKFFEET